MSEEIIPQQEEGASSDTMAERQLSSEEEAKSFFARVKKRLLDVNHWHRLAGKATADFELTDEKGRKVSRPVQEKDHFRIDIPGPGTVTGEGYDWVQVEAIEEEEKEDHAFLAIRVRPAPHPGKQQEVAHFFADAATSSFMVERRSNKVIAGVYGRNEMPNTATGKMADKARNLAVAAGALTGMAKLQWKSLVNGLVSDDNDKV